MSVVTMDFESYYLKSRHEISIILPDRPRAAIPRDFYQESQKFKVLWLLHGTFGDHLDWIRRTNIELYACERNLVVVMPSALNSNYSDWPEMMMGFNMYSYLTEELMPLIYSWFPVSRSREDNYIAGLSMGGRGSIKYAVNHPELFAGAAQLSSAPVDMSEMMMGSLSERDLISIKNAGGLEAFRNSCENTWSIIERDCGKGILPKLYFCCGTKDMLYPRYCKFKAFAARIGLNAKFEELEGYAHEWRFWDICIERALDYFGIDKVLNVSSMI